MAYTLRLDEKEEEILKQIKLITHQASATKAIITSWPLLLKLNEEHQNLLAEHEELKKNHTQLKVELDNFFSAHENIFKQIKTTIYTTKK